ncbi:hypothetical protein SAMN05880574_11188 [Chryseobacterium sp. RU37D]|uniref:hypothetical protein n=1 Tax=Chryseobacterium sp. RU37D TaxID=1907397 RepID=UPI000954E2E7|nr:hypothetical protein [Chryseobacterium sp. RU37D]SIQ38065.1 hypothetical protein SAMN05880574_11188 [Chryseobacterium sp. RU37D]
MHKRFLYFLLIFYTSLFFCQSVKGFHIPDSLRNKSFDELDNKFNQFRESNQSILYVNSYIVKAKKEKNIIKLINGYYLQTIKEKEKTGYIDSIKSIIKKSIDVKELSLGHRKIGNIYYNCGKYDLALSSYLIALSCR